MLAFGAALALFSTALRVPQRSLLAAARSSPRSVRPLLLAGEEADMQEMPSTDLPPLDVVHAQLRHLQRDDVQACYDFATSRVRQTSSPRERFVEHVRSSPALKPLIGSKSFEVLSALRLTDKRWRCRVRVENTVRCRLAPWICLAAPAARPSLPRPTDLRRSCILPAPSSP